ncbi:RagB/SusD family nutrient uptake outer membrane protein, partial [Pseudoxanthomonas sp. SGD-10]
GSITKFTLGKTDATSTSNWVVYKYADVLLMKAEALTFLDEGNAANGTAALAIVNDLREHRNALASTIDGLIEIPAPEETKKLGDLILSEKARESAFEGKRWFDILRYSKRNNYQDINLLLSIASDNALPSKQQIVINKYKDYRSHYLPIYYTELQTNKLLVQNPFY